tara:strand:+ start:267 stop:611 length:345 start_codon:yes stop_codon:yes gene_type:complete
MSSFIPDKTTAYELRQEDNGWWYALGHALPFINVLIIPFYALKRRTITPFIFILISNAFIRIPIKHLLADNYSSYVGYVMIISIISKTLLVKLGINRARGFASDKLRTESISDE